MKVICPGCGLSSDAREALCGVCWSEIPTAHRSTIRAAQRALGYNPASPRAQRDLQLAIANAMGAAR